MQQSKRTIHRKKKPTFATHALRFLLISSLLISIGTLLLSWKAIQYNEASQLPPNGKGLKNYVRRQVKFGDKAIKTAVEQTANTKVEAPVKKAEPVPPPPPSPKREDPKIVEVMKDEPKKNTKTDPNANSQLYQPDPKMGKRLLTYRRFGGRLNNQLFQFITALQHAKVLKRTLVVPDEIREVDWTGMFDTAFGIWDIDALNAAYDIDWVSALDPTFTTPDECLMHWREAPQLLEGGPKHWEEWDKKCPDIINIAGNTGLLFCERQHQFCGDSEAQKAAYEIYSHLRLSPEIMEYIPSKREEFKNAGYNEMAIHSRRAGEGGYDWELCIGGNRKTCSHHLDGENGVKFCDERTMKGNCAIWMDLEYQIKSKSALKKNQKDYRFVLASDGTHDWSIDYDGQFVVANNTEWLMSLEKKALEEVKSGKSVEAMATSSFAKERLKNKKDLSNIHGTMDALTATLLDLFSLVDSKYLLGAYYSTLSFNACYFRGVDRMYDSNMCWMLMHSETKLAIPPPEDSRIHVGGDESKEMPPALMSDVEHAFVRSKDGKFIAIDRYLVDNGRKRNTIAVLGDGLVPLTIEKGSDGKETVEAKFTCSMGDQLNTKATVILMKGNKSLHDHYLVQGEKYNTPFSTNGDRFRTLIILCEDLKYDKSLSRHPPLILTSDDPSFHLSIGSTFARPMGKPQTKRTQEQKKPEGLELVHCLNPVYGLKDPRWLIEYLEYHKTIGVSHVHIYNVDMHTPEVQEVLQYYRRQNFVTRHDWSSKASGEYTTKITYEHAKWASQSDCALRSRGQFDFALFSDIDEIAVGRNGGQLGPALDACAAAKDKDNKIGCTFNSNTVTSVYTKLDEKEEAYFKDKLMLERYSRMEAQPHCPANCYCSGSNCSNMTRKYHQGRQKYMINVRDSNIPPRPMWTHAISRDYDEMDKVMEVLDDDLIHVRHFQGHWYLNKDLLNTMEEKDSPLAEGVMNSVRNEIKSIIELWENYEKAKQAAINSSSMGVPWIKPVERPEKYHPNISK
ncbi:hypothetical protein ACHAXN_005857 [Cyclotella atomus]